MINILVAYDEKRGMGANGDLPWGRGLPSDLATFKRLTLGTSVIMGRKTFESIGRPLPGRENIVITRSPELKIDGAMCVNSLIQAIDRASQEPFVIGGGQIYREALPITDRIYATEVKATFPSADVFFPELDTDDWHEVSREHHLRSQGNDAYDYDFVVYDRTQ